MRIHELPVAAALLDSAGAVLEANAHWQLALSREGMAAQNVLPLVTAQRQKLQRTIARATASPDRCTRIELDLKTEALFRIELSLGVAADENGAAVIAVLRDISEVAELEAAQASAESERSAMLDALAHPALITDRDHTVEFVNSAFPTCFGVDAAPASLVGLPLANLCSQAPAFPTEFLAAVTAPSSFTGQAISPDWSLLCTPLSVEPGRERMLWQWLPQGLSNATPSGMVIESLGHEIATVLELSTSLAIRMEQMELSHHWVSTLDELRDAAEGALAALSGDGSARHSQAQGATAHHGAPFSLRGLLASLLDYVLVLASDSGVEVTLSVEQDVADDVEGNATALSMALKSLLVGLVRSVEGGHVSLTVAPEYFSDTTMSVLFSVQYEPASKSASAASLVPIRKAVAEQAIRKLGSTLVSPTSGTPERTWSFSVTLSVVPDIRAKVRPQLVTLTGLTALIVSANARLRTKLAGWLRSWRMLPLEADNAPMALALMQRLAEEGHPVPLLLLENKLPGHDGFLLAFRVKHHPRLSETVILMLADKGRPGDALACRENGIAAYLPQPIASERVHEAILAITGVEEGARDMPTLVTRHTLREERRGATVLLVDPDRDTQLAIENIVRRQDAALVVATTRGEAMEAAAQEVFDLVMVASDVPALPVAEAPAVLRAEMLRDASATPFVAIAREGDAVLADPARAGYVAALERPVERDALIALLVRIQRFGKASITA